MPVFEYRCKRCGRRTSKLFKTFAAVKTPPCGHCNSRRMERLYSRPMILRAGAGADDSDGGDGDFGDDSTMMKGLESGDPRSLARMARKMSDDMGEAIPPQYDTMLRRMESGEMPSDAEFDAIDPADEAGDDGNADEGL